MYIWYKFINVHMIYNLLMYIWYKFINAHLYSDIKSFNLHMLYNLFSQVEFLQKLFIEKIDIYETYHAGAVKRVLAKHPNGSWYTVWQTQKVSVIKSSRIFSPSFDVCIVWNTCTRISIAKLNIKNSTNICHHINVYCWRYFFSMNFILCS